MEKLGVYIHIPFCRSKCTYCDFVSSCESESTQREYVDALCKEIEQRAENYRDYVVDTVYIGGGTPSCLKRGEIARIVQSLRQSFSCDICEFTCECNPDTFSEEKAYELKSVGVNRVSIGVQTFNDNILKKIERRHSSEIAKNAIRIAKNCGFKVSIDQMLGLEGQTAKDIDEFFDILVQYQLEHMSAYMLKVESGTKLYDQVNNGLNLPDDDATAQLYDYTVEKAESFGYRRYETSNFCLNNEQCIHNMKYWTMQDYVGFGISAHGKKGRERQYNTSELQEYIKCVNAGKKYTYIEELLDEDGELEEYIMLGLRLEQGVDIKQIEQKFNIDFAKKYKDSIKATQNYITICNGKLKIKPRYALVANSIIKKFI